MSKSNETILATMFFPDQIKVSDWEHLKAPDQVLAARDMYKELWLNAPFSDESKEPTVRLRPVFEPERTGWEISLTVRPKDVSILEKIKPSLRQTVWDLQWRQMTGNLRR